MSLNTYNDRKEKGLCVYCGIEKDSTGVVCEACKAKQKESRKHSREFYRSIGICPNCKKIPIYLNEKSCFECNEKRNMYNSKNRKEVNKRASDKRIAKLKEMGICIQCGKRNAEPNRVSCDRCLAKARERNNKGKILRDERFKYGLCYTCGKPAEGGRRTCNECYERNIGKLKIAWSRADTSNHYWRKDEQVRYGNMCIKQNYG